VAGSVEPVKTVAIKRRNAAVIVPPVSVVRIAVPDVLMAIGNEKRWSSVYRRFMGSVTII
jgi:K+/H+ antiporter YhaU regulatory subunit KhtT